MSPAGLKRVQGLSPIRACRLSSSSLLLRPDPAAKIRPRTPIHGGARVCAPFSAFDLAGVLEGVWSLNVQPRLQPDIAEPVDRNPVGVDPVGRDPITPALPKRPWEPGRVWHDQSCVF